MTRRKADPHKWDNLPRFRPSEAPKTKWLWENFIPEHSITFLVAAAGGYKSTFTAALCAAISTGQRFLGRRTRKRRVLYLDNENPLDVLRERDEAMHLGLETNGRFRLWSLYDKVRLPRLGSHKLREIVRQSVRDGERPLIVFDNWSCYLKSGDGGETTGQTTPILQELRYLCVLGATVIVLIHTRKHDKTKWYGTEDILAKADAMHTLIREKKPADPSRPVIQIKCFLKRHGGWSSFAIQPVVENGRLTGFRKVEHPRKRKQRMEIELLREIIREHPDADQGELVARARKKGMGKSHAAKQLKKGAGKYWNIDKRSHGKHIYKLRES